MYFTHRLEYYRHRRIAALSMAFSVGVLALMASVIALL